MIGSALDKHQKLVYKLKKNTSPVTSVKIQTALGLLHTRAHLGQLNSTYRIGCMESFVFGMWMKDLHGVKIQGTKSILLLLSY